MVRWTLLQEGKYRVMCGKEQFQGRGARAKHQNYKEFPGEQDALDKARRLNESSRWWEGR